MRTETKQTLADFLNVREMRLEETHLAQRVVGVLFSQRYNTQPVLESYEERLRRELKLFVTISVPLSHFFPERSKINRRELTSKRDELEQRIEQTSIKEVEETAEILVEKTRQEKPRDYYNTLLEVYLQTTRICKEFSNTMLFFSTEVAQQVGIHKVVSISELHGLFGRERFDKELGNLPLEIGIWFFEKKDITLQDIEELKGKLERYDARRNELHRIILNHAAEKLGKDKLDVFVDILSDNERVDGPRLYAPVNKKGRIISVVGVSEIKIGHPEFHMRGYGQPMDCCWGTKEEIWEQTKENEERLVRALNKAREDSLTWLEPTYKSLVKSGRREEQDRALLNQVRAKYPGYVVFTGDWPNCTFHGSTTFLKLAEFDVSKIRIQERNPEGKIEEIKNYIESQDT